MQHHRILVEIEIHFNRIGRAQMCEFFGIESHHYFLKRISVLNYWNFPYCKEELLLSLAIVYCDDFYIFRVVHNPSFSSARKNYLLLLWFLLIEYYTVFVIVAVVAFFIFNEFFYLFISLNKRR